jgi:hypothetical protein
MAVLKPQFSYEKTEKQYDETVDVWKTSYIIYIHENEEKILKAEVTLAHMENDDTDQLLAISLPQYFE